MAKKTALVPAEIVNPKVETQAAVQINLTVEDGVDPVFTRADYQARLLLDDRIKKAKEKRAEAAEARSLFGTLINRIEDQAAVDAIVGHQARLRNLLDQLAGDFPGMVSTLAEKEEDEDETEDAQGGAALPKYNPNGVSRLGSNEKKRTRTFKVEGAATNGKGKDVFSSYGLEGANAAGLRLSFVFTLPLSQAQCEALDREATAIKEAEALEAEVKQLQTYRSIELPQLKKLAVAEAKERWLGKAEGAAAIYDEAFKQTLGEHLAGAIARSGLSASAQKQLTSKTK